MDRAGVAANQGRGWLWATISLIPIALFQWVVFFSDLDHFFQGDTVYWLYHRHRSWGSFFHAFVSTDDSGWYRPLANRILESLIYPFHGLNPVPYHLALFPVLLLDTLAVYVLCWMLTQRRLAAFLATFFFGTHLVNTYVTYDVSFLPELFYTLFYVTTAIAYLKYLRTRKSSMFAASVLGCVAAFCSKEPGVTLPFMLVVVHVIETGSLPKWKSSGPLKWCFALLLLYGAFVVGYLRVGGIGSHSFFDRSQETAAGYQVVFDRGVFLNAGKALSEAFMLRAGQLKNLPPGLMPAVKIFRLGALALCLLTLLSRKRKVVLLGLIWFFVTSLPVLTLGNHFMLYYLFLPVVGLSLAIAVAFDFGFDHVARLGRFARPVALAVVGILFGAIVAISAAASVNERIATGLLGGSSRAAQDAVATIRAKHPHLAAGTTLLFLDKAGPQLPWNDAQGALFRMAFDEERLTVWHASEGESIEFDQLEDERSIVVRYSGGVFREISGQERLDEVFPTEDKSGDAVSVVPTRVIAERGGSYILRVSGLGAVEVKIYYRLNGGPMQSFGARLRDDGGVSFDVGADTRKGTYQFVAVAVVPLGASKVIRTDKTLVID